MKDYSSLKHPEAVGVRPSEKDRVGCLTCVQGLTGLLISRRRSSAGWT